jgi:hypothetical protein
LVHVAAIDVLCSDDYCIRPEAMPLSEAAEGRSIERTANEFGYRMLSTI